MQIIKSPERIIIKDTFPVKQSGNSLARDTFIIDGYYNIDKRLAEQWKFHVDPDALRLINEYVNRI